MAMDSVSWMTRWLMIVLILFESVVLATSRKSLKLCSVDVEVTPVTESGHHGYQARISTETEASGGMALVNSWQLYNRLEDGTLYEVPIDDQVENQDVELSAFYNRLIPNTPAISHLQATSKGPDLKLFYSYTIADDVTRTGLTLVEMIDTKRTEDQQIAIDLYNAHERNIIEVYIEDADQGVIYAEDGETVTIRCSYTTKYNFFRHWTWRRTPLINDITHGSAHPLHYDVIVVSGNEGGHFVDNGYNLTVQEYEVPGGHMFVCTLVINNFNSQLHSAVYHFNAEDWSMASIQPWVLRVDRFVEIVPSGSTSLLDPVQLFPQDTAYLEISTCSKKGADVGQAVIMDPEHPDCVVCISYGDVTPQLTKDGVELTGVRTWPLTVRSPHLKLVYVVLSPPNAEESGLYRCSGATTLTSQQKDVYMQIQVQ